MSRSYIDRLLDDNWLIEKNWITYNKQLRFVRAALREMEHGVAKQQGVDLKELSEEEFLPLEMLALREILVSYYISKVYSDPMPEKEVRALNINDLFELTMEVYSLYGKQKREDQLRYGGTAMDLRKLFYKCPRKVP